ncbi:MAG: MoaD/ThiS family protein [Alphaproteobacteria bacterium]|nr:MoaD/ThiS family protein [Alphaproteobacteria bacterium]
MARVAFTDNLKRHIACPVVRADGRTVAAVLDTVFAANPRLRSYVLDDQGRLRRHVHVYVNAERIADPIALSDRVRPDDEVFVFQALSGG